MEVDQKSKHKCKFCSKIFPCGRSLGGHMRSHLINISSTEKKLPPFTKNDHPDKARKRFLSHDAGDDKLCKECGKAFHSWKALFGHMKSHSAIEINEEDSWQSSSDEAAAAALCRKKRSQRAKRYTDSSPDLSPCSAASEQEEVALSLILLSMDCMNSSLQSHNTTSFESNNKARDGEEREMESKAPRNKRSKTNQNLENDQSEVNSPKTMIKKMGPFSRSDHNKNEWSDSECKFRCMICNKGFPSYQALGGHRASHKKFKGCCAPTTTTPPSPKLAQSLEECKKSKDHECPICFKIFPSGQALGGHKRSHLINDQAKNSITDDLCVEERRIPQVRNFLDLNLPAPLEEDCNIELKPWWIGATHEPLLGLLSSS